MINVLYKNYNKNIFKNQNYIKITLMKYNVLLLVYVKDM